MVYSARYWPASATTGVEMVYVFEVAPEMSVHTLLIFFCHFTVGVGKPLAAAVKVTLVPAHTEGEALG